MNEENTVEYNRLSDALTDGPVSREDETQRDPNDYAERTEVTRPDEPVMEERQVIDNNGSGYEINIKTLNSGYLVTVGCQQIAVEKTGTLVKALGEYLENPSEYQARWFNNPNRNKLS